MLMAAGRGERMRPLTDHCPKPLLQVHGKPLLQWHLQALAEGACKQVVINTAWLGEQIQQHFGTRFTHPQASAGHHDNRCGALPIRYSDEGRDFGAALGVGAGRSTSRSARSGSSWARGENGGFLRFSEGYGSFT